MDLQKIKDDLKEMYPTMQGFIQHTLVAEMCLKWHEMKVKNLYITDVKEQSEQLKCLMEDDKPNCNCELNHCLKKGW